MSSTYILLIPILLLKTGLDRDKKLTIDWCAFHDKAAVFTGFYLQIHYTSWRTVSSVYSVIQLAVTHFSRKLLPDFFFFWRFYL